MCKKVTFFSAEYYKKMSLSANFNDFSQFMTYEIHCLLRHSWHTVKCCSLSDIFCHHLTQIMTTDFVRFTSFASFEAQNNVCKSSSIWQIQLSYFGLNGDKICWSDKEKPVKAQKTMRQSRNNIKANTFPKIRKTIWKWNDFI